MIKKYFINTILIIFSLSVGLIIIETTLSYIKSIKTKTLKNEISWIERVGRKQHNKFGFRDKDFAIQKSKNTFRILAIGDSMTYGYLFDNYLMTWPKILEQKLNLHSKNINYQVINTSYPGLNTRQQYENLIQDWIKFSPDLIIIGFCLNDPVNCTNDIPQIKQKYRKSLLVDRIKKLMYLIKLKEVFNTIDELFKLTEKSNLNFIELYHSFYKKSEPHWADYIDAQEKIINFCNNNHIPLYIALIPIFAFEDQDTYPFVDIHKYLNQYFINKKIPLIDLYNSIPWDSSNPKKFWVTKTNSHPNILAHQIIGEAIYKDLKKIKLILK